MTRTLLEMAACEGLRAINRIHRGLPDAAQVYAWLAAHYAFVARPELRGE